MYTKLLPKFLAGTFILLSSIQVKAQNVNSYFDDGINSNLGLFVSTNVAQYLTGHYTVTVEKNIFDRMSIAADFGVVNDKSMKYATLGVEALEDSTYIGSKGNVFGVTVNYQIQWLNDYGQIGFRYRRYNYTLANDSTTTMDDYTVLCGAKYLWRNHVFLHAYYGFGFRLGKVKNEYSEETTTDLVGISVPIGIGIGLYF